MSDFVHLHCHTEYSLLDGAIRIKDLCKTAKDFGLPAAAITDHGNMYGAVNFYMTALDFGIKPIMGCEVYVAPGDRRDKGAKSSKQAAYHLVLLPQNLTGYRNLLKMVTEGHLTGFHYRPRIDKELMRKHSEGIICLSACLAGEVPRTLLHEGMDAGLAVAREYQDIYKNNFYLELQANGLEEQFRVNDMLLEVGEKLNIPMVATNDCHYLRADDVEAHDVLLCIQTAAQVDDAKRMRFETKELYYRSPEEMEKEFDFCPQAIENTQRIAEQCNVQLDLKSLHFPVYDLPEGMTLEAEFRKLAEDGLKKRLEAMPPMSEEETRKYWDRLNYELNVICEMGFPGYFLIVQDFINWAKDHGIPVGPGRGSAAGSLVAFALKITNLDPLPYDLLFERFLNVERVSMPDIDIDFCERRRLEVIREYVVPKYGEDAVAQITTFGTMKAKGVVRDVGRALGMTFGETDRIAKLVPDEMKMTIEKALEKEPDLAVLYETDPQINKLLEICKRLEGLARHASTHAAGVVISDKPMVEYLPLYKGKKGETVTQFDGKKVEKIGLVKFDFLGLRTMTVLQDALDNIARQDKKTPDLDVLPLDDPKTYELYSRGDTDGVFQVESGGMRSYLRKLRPNCFEDIIAMLALYRPGPLGSGMVDEFINRKHGRVEVSYPWPTLEKTLQPTYGVIVYQEQVMSIAMIMANYSLGEGDLLRRAMGKKIQAEMAQQRKRFIEGCRENKIPDEKGNEVFDLMEKFAAYGFNKSHSAAYALISYHTAYLKTHFPREFMAALMTSEIENQDKILKYIGSCRDMDITVAGPDVNKSDYQFTVEDETIRYGMGGIKNIGYEAIKELVEERRKNGPFKSMLDLCTRLNTRKITKRVLENMVQSGAMDSFGITRCGLFNGIGRVVSMAQKKQKEKDSGQLSMLAMLPGEDICLPGLGLSCTEQTMEEWPDEDLLKREKDALGFYLSSHPLLAHYREIQRLGLHTLEDCADYSAEVEVKVPVIITDCKEKFTKKGDKMAICLVEDLTGSCEMLVFPRAYEEMKDILGTDQPLIVTAKIAPQDEDEGEDAPKKAKLFAQSAKFLLEVQAGSTDPVDIYATAEACAPERLEPFKEILSRYPGGAPIYMHIKVNESVCRLQLGPKYTVQPNPQFYQDVDEWLKAAG